MTDPSSLFAGQPVVPVVVIESVESAGPLADALVAGGLPCAEITFRTAAALDVVRALAERKDIFVGAGSVRTPEQVDAAVQAGASFIVSPGLSDAVLARCRALGVPSLPGVATATEIMRALDAGVDVVKLFPAGLLGGPAGVRGLAAPFPSLHFVPTGGIGPADLADYLRIPAVVAVGGSWMVAPELIRTCQFEEIRRLSQEAVAAAVEARR